MAFSNLVLPNVAPVQQGGPLVNAMQGINSLANNMANTQTAQATAKYAPYNQYGTAALNIAQANMLPYQIQSQILSNPLTWMAAQNNPAMQNQLQQIAGNLSKSMPIGGNVFGNVQIPIPGQSSGMGNSIGRVLGNLFGNSPSPNAMQQPSGGVPSGNAMQTNPTVNSQSSPSQNQGNTQTPTQTSGTPILPASQDNAIGGTMTALYNQSPYKAGDLIWDSQNKKVISNASNAVIQQAQQGLSGLQRIDPLIRRLGIEQFPDQSGWTSLLGDIEAKQNRWGPKALNNFFPQIQNQYPDIAKEFNLTGLALPTLRARAESDIATAPEQLIRIYGLKPGKYTNQELAQIIKPGEGETGDQYTQRLMEKITQMQQEEGAPYKKQLSQGFDVTNPNQTTNNSSSPSGTTPSPTFDAGKFLDQKFENSDEFKHAFDSYNDSIKQMIVNEMHKRGWK